ncbi:ArnT family glycosyltransferase [Desulfurella sp.]|uniref:ArnT family glycosyltransferase n=1 Tax=Desulfurella sp. TaxID=1962857 RepID=UPI003D0B3813
MPKRIFAVFFALYLLASLFNLGKVDFSYKEAKSAIISLQMNKSGNYKWQTILGRPYFKKPPLGSYYTSIFFKIFGENQWQARFGQFVFIILTALLPFILKKEFEGIDPFYFASIYLTTVIVLLSINNYSLYPSAVFFLFMAFIKVYFRQKNFAIWLILAFLTLGLSAIFLFYFILLCFVALEKNKELISIKEHLVALVLIVFLSLFGIALYGLNITSIHYLAGSLFLGFLQSFNFKNYLWHLISFPFIAFFLLLPWSIFIKNFFRKYDTRLYRFALNGSIGVFFLMWILPFENYLILVPFFASLVSFYKVNIDSFYLKLAAIFFIMLTCAAILFGYLFAKDSNYLFLLFFSIFVAVFLYKQSKKYALNQYMYIVVFLICAKAAYSMVYIPYEASYMPDMSVYGKKIASIILKNKAKYVMSNNVHLDLLYYVEKESNLPIYIPQKSKGALITQNKEVLKKVYGSEFSPYGVFYVGEY